jgi:hypothetical protein
MILGGFTISTVVSLQFAVVNRHKILDGIAVQNDLCAVNCAALRRCLTVIDFNNFSSFLLLIYLTIYFLDGQKSRMLRLKKCRM